MEPQPAGSPSTRTSTEDLMLGSAHYKPRPPRLPLGLLRVQLHTSVSPRSPPPLHPNTLISLHSAGVSPSLSDVTTHELLGIDHGDPSQSPGPAEPGKNNG